MPYYKKVKKKINGKWYPQSVTVGDPVTTDEIAQLLADFSSASVGDTYNILKNLARAMSIYMSNGRRSTTRPSPTARAWIPPRR